MSETGTPVRRILYFGDPMCSWCYGFAPVVASIVARFAETAPLWLVLGGLRPGWSEPMDEFMKERMRSHWVRVKETTGQPFDFTFFEREGFVYDTEPACRATVAVRTMMLPPQALCYFRAVQTAFYAEGRDTTRAGVLADLAGQVGIDAADFAAMVEAEEIQAATSADFRMTRMLGVSEFPSLVLQEGTRYAYLTAGYRPLEELVPTLERWVSETGAGALV